MKKFFWVTLFTVCMCGLGSSVRLAANEPAIKPLEAKPWSFIIIPDTQHYAQFYPEVYLKQTAWIAEKAKELNVQFVLHVGDVTDNDSHPEWMVARQAMNTLRSSAIPYIMASGNHDIGVWGSSADRSSRYSSYFNEMDFAAPNLGYRPWDSFGFFKRGEMENTYVTKQVGEAKFLILNLEFGPRHTVVDWANQVVANHPDHYVILLTHAYLYSDSTRYDWATKGSAQKWNPMNYAIGRLPEGANDGEALWQKLVSRHPGFVFTFSGHVGNNGTGYLVSEGAKGADVHQILQDYQTEVEPHYQDGGGGFLRIYTVHADGRTVDVKTYSPHLDQWLTAPDQQFTIQLKRNLHQAIK